MNKIEIFNEATFLVVCYCFLLFLDQQDSYEMKYLVGWLLIGISCINTGANFLVITY